MKVIIAGSRSITDYLVVSRAVEESGFCITEVISGGAAGVDTLGEIWAARSGIPVRRMPPPYGWNVPAKIAPKVRNWSMADDADALVAVWDGFSGGTAHMVAAMVFLHKPIYLVKREKNESAGG